MSKIYNTNKYIDITTCNTAYNDLIKQYINNVCSKNDKYSLSYVLNILCISYNDAEFISDNKLHICNENSKPILYYESEIDTEHNIDIYLKSNWVNRYIDFYKLNDDFIYYKRYPIFTFNEVIQYISKCCNINYVICDSPCSTEKKVVYIENTQNDKILKFIRNDNNTTNEWSYLRYNEMAIAIYKYFITYFKLNYNKL